MTYVVTWSPAALAMLGRISAGHPDPAAVDREALWMDSILRRYPRDMGEARPRSHRLWYADHIGV